MQNFLPILSAWEAVDGRVQQERKEDTFSNNKDQCDFALCDWAVVLACIGLSSHMCRRLMYTSMCMCKVWQTHPLIVLCVCVICIFLGSSFAYLIWLRKRIQFTFVWLFKVFNEWRVKIFPWKWCALLICIKIKGDLWLLRLWQSSFALLFSKKAVMMNNQIGEFTEQQKNTFSYILPIFLTVFLFLLLKSYKSYPHMHQCVWLIIIIARINVLSHLIMQTCCNQLDKANTYSYKLTHWATHFCIAANSLVALLFSLCHRISLIVHFSLHFH